MRLWIKGSDRDVTSSMREILRARLEPKLSRLSRRIQSVAITVRDVNGPRGGCDHEICVSMHLRPTGRIVVRHRASEVLGGTQAAVKRALKAFRREHGRRRQRRSVTQQGDPVELPLPAA
jgi:putative sigma-54 modulation protein